MPFRRLTFEVPTDVFVSGGLVPKVFFEHNASIEVLRVYAFQPKERVLLARIVRDGPPLSEQDVLDRQDTLRRRYGLKSFEVVRVESGGKAYVAILRQRNPGALERALEELGAGIVPTTPTVIGRETAVVSFLMDEEAERAAVAMLRDMGVPWRLRRRRAARVTEVPGDDLTTRQREVLDLAWRLGYFEIPAEVGLAKLSEITGLSRNSISQHLRRGLRKVLRERFEA